MNAETLAAWTAYERANKAASREYYRDPDAHLCPWGKCDDEYSCRLCRRTARADLLVATSVEECHDLLAILDRPPLTSVTRATKPCGTPAAYVRHLRHGEKACEACLVAIRAYKSDRPDARASNREAARRYRVAKKSGGAA